MTYGRRGSSTSWQGVLPLTGGTMTGPLTANNGITVSGSAYPSLVFSRIGAGGNQILGQTSGSNRWILRLGDNDAETGNNAGSSFKLYSYDDSGNNNHTVLSADRATGSMVFGGNSNGVYPPTAFGWASAFNVSGGAGEADFINLYPSAVASFRWIQMTGAQAGKTLMQLMSDATLQVSGPVVLPADPTAALQAATKQYVDNAIAASRPPAVIISDTPPP